MTTLHRTNLTTPQKIQCAAAAVSRQHEHGATTAISREHGISRPTVYAVGAAAEALLEAHFESTLLGDAAVMVRVDEAQLRRALVALRVVAPNSLRAIEDLLPLLYPGVKVSYGKIQQLLVEAEGRACEFNAQADLSGIQAGALDEMFSQGEPVLAGVDLDGGYLFGLQLSASRDAQTWAQLLRAGQGQGLELSVVVKDAALGIAAGVSTVFPDAEQRDDCFHALYEMNKVRRRLEQRAYGAIEAEMEAQRKLAKIGACHRQQRDTQRGKLVWEQRRCRQAIARYERCAWAVDEVREAIACVDLDSAELRDVEAVQTRIEAAACAMAELDDSHANKVSKYLHNRAPGLALAMAELRPKLDALSEHHGEAAVRLSCLAWRLADELNNHSCHRARRDQYTHHLLGVYAQLRAHLGDKGAEALLESVKTLLEHHHRASSAIEGFNAALRPYLYVHKGVTQGFLDLFRAHFNLRTRRWGRHKGSSAHQTLTGEAVTDWLTVLGYPPSPTLH